MVLVHCRVHHSGLYRLLVRLDGSSAAIDAVRIHYQSVWHPCLPLLCCLFFFLLPYAWPIVVILCSIVSLRRISSVYALIVSYIPCFSNFVLAPFICREYALVNWSNPVTIFLSIVSQYRAETQKRTTIFIFPRTTRDGVIRRYSSYASRSHEDDNDLNLRKQRP